MEKLLVSVFANGLGFLFALMFSLAIAAPVALLALLIGLRWDVLVALVFVSPSPIDKKANEAEGMNGGRLSRRVLQIASAVHLLSVAGVPVWIAL